MSQPLTLNNLEAALRAAGAVGQSSTLFPGTVAFNLFVRDPKEGPLAAPVSITGQGPDLAAAAIDALRKLSTSAVPR